MSLSDKSFMQNFRLNKHAFLYDLDNIRPQLKVAQRTTSIPEIVKLSTTLKFLAQGGYQNSVGQDRHSGLAQQLVSRCILEVCDAIAKTLCPKHIVFPLTIEEKIGANRTFCLTSGIPAVIGVIDGTHIPLIRPSRNEHLFFNRKLKHRINAMVICNHEMQIRAVNGKFGGASHDSHVWNLSGERGSWRTNYENGNRSERILEDSGYPLETWLLTPYRNAPERSDELFSPTVYKRPITN